MRVQLLASNEINDPLRMMRFVQLSNNRYKIETVKCYCVDRHCRCMAHGVRRAAGHTCAFAFPPRDAF